MTEIVHAEPTEVQAKHAYEVESRVKDAIFQIRGAWVLLARDLYEFFSDQLWQKLGHDSFEAWLASPDIELSRRWVYELIAQYRELVVLRDVEPERLQSLEPSKVQLVLPAIRRKQVTIGAALADVETLSRNDLRERYGPQGAGTTRTAAGSAPDTSTRYDAEAEPMFVRCHVCGSRVRQEDIRA